MRLLVSLVLVVLTNKSSCHWVVPYVSNGQLISPYGYVVHHTLPDFIEHQQPAVSRETLEENSGEGFLQQIPDISVEQAHLNPVDDNNDGTQKNFGQVPNVLFNGPQSDGSYDFAYQLGDQSRSEKSDAQGNVQGSYSYTGPDGNEVKVTYTAGANKGYIPEGKGLVPPPPAHGADDPWEDQKPQVPQIPEDDSQQHIPPVGPTKRPTVPKVDEEEEHHGGMPYSYNYDAGLSSKTETADDQGNVQGSYTYVDGAGVKRTVTYTVKGNEGFIATGDIHPDPGSETDTSGRGDVTPGRKPIPTPHNGGGSQKPIPPRVPPPTNGGGQRPIPPRVPPPTDGGGQKPIPPRVSPPTKGVRPVQPPPTKGVRPVQPPPTKGGRPVQPPPVKGGSGWDKYPLGR